MSARLLAASLGLVLLAACGQRGPLYLPTADETAVPQRTPSPAAETPGGDPAQAPADQPQPDAAPPEESSEDDESEDKPEKPPAPAPDAPR